MTSVRGMLKERKWGRISELLQLLGRKTMSDPARTPSHRRQRQAPHDNHLRRPLSSTPQLHRQHRAHDEVPQHRLLKRLKLYQTRLDERLVRSASSTLKRAMTCVCCHARASTGSIKNAWINGCWSCQAVVRFADKVCSLTYSYSAYIHLCHPSTDFHTLETMMSRDSSSPEYLEPPSMPHARPLSGAGARLSRYLRLARRRRHENNESSGLSTIASHNNSSTNAARGPEALYEDHIAAGVNVPLPPSL